MKKWAKLLSVSMLALSLAACGNGNTKNASNGGKTNEGDTNKNTTEKTEKVELTFWSLGANGYDELISEWNAANPDIQVKNQNTGDQTVHHNNLLTALSAGSGAPDIFHLEIGFMEKFIGATDKFYNLYDLGAKDIESNYLGWKWQQATSPDGSFQLGLPTDVGPTVVYYRTDVVEKGGLPTDPEKFGETISTWDKFAQVAKAYTDKTGIPFADSTSLLFNALRDQSTDEIYYSKADGSFIGDTNPQVKKAFDFTVKAIKEGWVGKADLWANDWNAGFGDGKFATVLGPAWMKASVMENAGDSKGKWSVTQLPEGAGNWGGSFLTLPKEGKHPAEAYKFISWLASKESQLESFKNAGLMPSIPALYSEEAFNAPDEFFGGQSIAKEYAKAAENVKGVYYGPLHDATDAFFKEALRNVLEKGSDPQVEWDGAVKKAKDLVKRGG